MTCQDNIFSPTDNFPLYCVVGVSLTLNYEGQFFDLDYEEILQQDS